MRDLLHLLFSFRCSHSSGAYSEIPGNLYYKLLGKGLCLLVIYIIVLCGGIIGPRFIFANLVIKWNT
jgi:hypothetical protein